MLYAIGFRSYWAVIVVLYLVLMAGWRMGLGWPARLALVAIAIVPLSLASEAIIGFWLSDGRTVVVEAREGDPDSATMFFNPWINTSPATDLANTIAGWLTLVLPFYLLALGAVQHVAFALFQFANTALFVRAVRALPRPRRGVAPSAREWQLAAAAAWCVAYTIVQGMFEPDFGSFVKHAANLAPMLMLLVSRHATRTVPTSQPVAGARADYSGSSPAHPAAHRGLRRRRVHVAHRLSSGLPHAATRCTSHSPAAARRTGT